MKKILLFIAPAMISLGACNNPTPATNTETTKDSTEMFDLSSVKSTIDESNKAFSEALIKGDSVAVANSYTSDAHMLPPNMPPANDHKAIESMAAGFAKMGIKKFSVESTDVYGGPDMVTEEGKYMIGDNTGKTLDEGKYIVLWKKEDGKWKMYRDIWNSNMPPPPAPKK